MKNDHKKLFGHEIKYTNPEEATARYNGNIAEIDRAKAIGFNEPTIRRYSYSYDAINRLTNANFSEPNTAMNIFTSTNRQRRFADSIKNNKKQRGKDHLDKREQSVTLGEDWERSWVRISYKDDGKPLVVDSNDFYPFGMRFVRNEDEEAKFGVGSFYNYKYQEQELQETGFYPVKWRNYMPE